MEKSVSPAVLAKIAAEFFEEFDHSFGENSHFLDWSLHLDESTPHIHERHVFDCETVMAKSLRNRKKHSKYLGSIFRILIRSGQVKKQKNDF